MAIEAQFNNQPDSNSPSLDPVEQLKAQAKIQMAITTAELDGPLPLPALSAESQTEASPIVSSPDHTDANGSVTAWVPAQANPESNSAPALPSVPRSLPPPHIAQSIPCRFYAIGACKYGDACPFSHSLAPNVGGVALLPGMSNADNSSFNGSTLTSDSAPPTCAFRPHPAQSYEEAAMQRYYGYPECGVMPSVDQSVSNPPPTSTTSAPNTSELPGLDQQPYYPPPGPTTYDGYYPPGPPPPHAFPMGPHVNGYPPTSNLDGNPTTYYPFPNSMPPHVYAPMPPHAPQGYYDMPPPGSAVFDGYQNGHRLNMGPDDTNPGCVHPSQPPNDPAYYPQYAAYPPPPPADGSPCPPPGDGLLQHPPAPDHDSAAYPTFVDIPNDGSQIPFRPMEPYSGSPAAYPGGPSRPHTIENGEPKTGNSDMAHGVDSAQPSPVAGMPRFSRPHGHGMSGARRGPAFRGNRPFRPRISPGGGSGSSFGALRAAGVGPNSSSAQSPASAGPHSASALSRFPSLASTPIEERGPRGPCSFFAENRCRFGDDCLWAHVMPNGDDAREYGLNYVGPAAPSKDGLLGSEVGFGTKMSRKLDGFDSRAIPGYALWEKRYKDHSQRASVRSKSASGLSDRHASTESAGVRLTQASIRQKVDELVQQRREGNIPGSQSHSHRANRGMSGASGPPRPSHHHPAHSHAQPHLKYVSASAMRTQRIPSGEDFPALRPITSANMTADKSSNGVASGPSAFTSPLTNGKQDCTSGSPGGGSNDGETSSNSGATEASASTTATSTKDSPALPAAPARKAPSAIAGIAGGSFALAAARGASAPAPKPLTNARKAPAPASVTAPPVTSTPTSSSLNGVEDAMKALKINEPQDVVAST